MDAGIIMRTAMLIIVILCSMMHSSLAALEIIGDGNPENGIEDNRLPISSLKTPILQQIRSVGVFRCGQHIIGSGIIVKADNDKALILTAGHVIASKKTSECQFHPYNMYEGYKFFLKMGAIGSKISKPEFKSGSDNGPKNGKFLYENDWAIVQVNADLSSYGQAVFNNRKVPLKYERDALLIAYDPDYATLAASSEDCKIMPKVKNGLAYNQLSIGLDSCDSSKSASGGAVFLINKVGEISLFAIRTGFIINEKTQSARLLTNKQLQKGSKADPKVFANTHHVMTKAIRTHIKNIWHEKKLGSAP